MVDQLTPSPTPQGARSREAILRAATELFAQNGYAATTLAQVGVRAGLSRGTPGYFFGSKDELYGAVLERAFQEARDALVAASEQARADSACREEVFRRSVGAYIDFLAEHPEFVRLVEWETLGHGRGLQESSPHLAMVMAALGAIGDAFAAELPAGYDTTQLMLSIAGLCWFPLAHRETLGRVLGVDARDPAFLADRKTHVVDLVLRGIRGTSR